jgi:hypothetical protein
MPRTKVGGLRSAAQGALAPDETVLPESREGRFQFRSKAASFVLSLRRRRILRGPDGEAIEEAPRSKLDNAMDWVKFEDHNYETEDPEIADLIRAKPGYGMGLQFWSLDEQRAAHDKAYEEELRRKIADRPDIAKRVLKPSDKEDFTVPQVS